jgi:signal transduction histidine kinase
VYNAANEVVFQEGDGRREPVPVEMLAEVRENRQVIIKDKDLRQTIGVLYHDAQRGDFVVVASSLDADSRRQLRNLRRRLLGGFLVSLSVVGIGGWFFARQALRPMQRIVQEVDSITASDLHRRLSKADGQDEVSHLAQRFNSLLDRLETAFAGQRNFVRDASHELRTPLAALIGELEVALLQERTPEEYRRTLSSTLDAARLLNNLTNGLLQIARASDDPSQVTLSTIRLDELLLQAHEEMQRRHPTCRIDLAFSEPENHKGASAFEVRGNEALLLAAMLNILENACKFSRGCDEPVVATLDATGKQVKLDVLDNGVGMNEADRQQVFVPFFRAETVRNVPGHGIGLPLTAKIMELHGGSVEVESQLHVGTRVRLTWPNVAA